MPEILSQKDLEALILSLTAEENKPSDRARKIGSAHKRHLVRVYDFKRPDKFSRDQIRTVEMLHDNIARLASTFLSAQVRSMVSVVVASVDQMTFEEFIGLLPNPSYVATVSMDPLKGNMFMAIDIPVALAMVDRLFGGPGTAPGRVRPLTEIELTIVDKISKGLLSSVRESWASLVALELKIEQSTSNPTFIQNVPSNEMTVVVRFDVKMGKVTGALTFCLPFVSIEPILPKLSARNWFTVLRREAARTEELTVLERLGSVELELVAMLGKAELTVRDILRLEPGDVIQLESRVNDSIEVKVGGRSKFRAKPGRTGSRLCFKVMEVIKEDEANG